MSPVVTLTLKNQGSVHRLCLHSHVSVMVLISLALPASDVAVVRFVNLYGPKGLKVHSKHLLTQQ